MNKFIIVIIVIFLLVCGCVATNDYSYNHISVAWIDEISNSGLYQGTMMKVNIPEDNVTCYVFKDTYKAGMTCFKN